MLPIIAWRNIWRSRTRSLVVIGAIMLGIWALVFMISFTVGMVRGYVDSAIQNSISHLQVHDPGFSQDQELRYYFPNAGAKADSLRALAGVENATARTLLNGMVSTGRGARGVQIRGIDPETESRVTHLEGKVFEGEFFPAEGRNAILVSAKLAERLGVRLRSKVVLTFQDLNGDITAGAFRIAGLFDTGNTPFDEANVFVRRGELNGLLGQADMAHELAAIVSDLEALPAIQAQAAGIFPNLKVENYRQISPDIQLYEGQIQTSATIFMVIIMLALLFGIVNTMLMAVLERVRELGMLMAIGMNKPRVFAMIVLETLMLAGVAVLPGLLVGWLTVSYYYRRGIDLSAFAGGMEQFGLTKIIYPQLQSDLYLQFAFAVAITAIVGSIYPALKAVRLRPVEAIRKI